jgi:cytosine/adenosine deaminase-related metal-dependent hydrolase
VSRILIQDGCVLTLGRTNHPRADVLIDGGRIVEIGPGLRARDAEVIDADGAIVMPGFVDGHRHAWETLFRNLAESVSPDRFGPHYGPDDVYAGTLIGLLSAADAGVTTVVDWCGAGGGLEHLEAARQAHEDSRLRTVLVHAAAPWADGAWSDGIRSVASIQSPRMIGAAGPASSEGWVAARGAGLRIHAHAGTSPRDRGAIAALGAEGRLGPDVTLVHCSQADDADLEAIAGSGASVVTTPSSEMAGGMGPPPLQRIIDRGIRPGLGIGTELAGSPTDLFAQMRAAISVQHATYFDLKLAGKAGLPRLLTTREVIRWATIDGAHAVGVENVGALEPGMHADVIVLGAGAPNIHPVNDPIGAVVWGMDTSNVDWVLVGGEIVKGEGSLVGDIGRARSMAIEAQRRVARAAGLVPVGGAS